MTPELNNGGEIDAEGLLEGTMDYSRVRDRLRHVFGEALGRDPVCAGRVASGTVDWLADEAIRAGTAMVRVSLARQTIADRARIAELEQALEDCLIVLDRLKKHSRIADGAGYTNDGRMLRNRGVEAAARAALSKGAAPCR